jgi:3-dehydroquinate dehydratase-2
MKILIVNGPNLNWLGRREPEIYGSESFEDILQELKTAFPQTEILHVQSNVEGEIINELQKAEDDSSIMGIILNAAAYTHTSIAIADTLKSMKTKVILVHLSNIYNRETERHTDLLLANADGCILGLGKKSYFAASYLLNLKLID